jgi:hypothetical protein
MKSSVTEFGLPTTGAVLAFMVDCLGVPKETEAYSYKELERLKKGGLKTETYWAVTRKVMDAIVGSFLETKTASQTIDSVFKQKIATPIKRFHWQMHKGVLVPIPEFSAPPEAIYWKRNAAGELEDFGEILVHDWTEFLARHEFLVMQCGSTITPRLDVVFNWTCRFVVPFLAVNLLDYQRNNSQLESGMPGGRFWYLPLILPENADSKPRIKWPVNTVLEWWEDLSGSKLATHASLLCAPGDNPDNARRQVHAWQHEKSPPDQVTIARWCKVSWVDRYAGTFLDDISLPLNERWYRCRDFLKKKGFHDSTSNWLDGVQGKPRETLLKQYRGEMLEQEIPPFKQTPFAAFFDLPDPIAAGLPVEDLIERIAERYAQPTNRQLKTRLIIAAAFQRAFIQMIEVQEIQNALRICDWFQEVYCYLVDLNNQAAGGDEILRKIRNASESQGGLRYACEWLYDAGVWNKMPTELMADFLKSQTDAKKS